MKVFLGGTCGKIDWREQLIQLLNEKVEYFNPVVEDWTSECIEEENRQKEVCDVHLYLITPEQAGVYAIAEMVHSVMKGKAVIACFLRETGNFAFSESRWRSITETANLIEREGAKIHFSVEGVARYLNKEARSTADGR